jgi:hypothetical protein
MLLNHIDYEIYYAGGCSESRLIRRESWPRGSARPATATQPALRVALGHALIGLGRLIAAENRTPVTAANRH